MKGLLRPFVAFFMSFFLFFWRRKKQVVLCTGWRGKRFADNSRYMFLYLNEQKEALQLKKIIWIAQDRSIAQELRRAGFTVYQKTSLKSIYYHLRAQYFFYDQFSDDFYHFLTYKADLVNLWHGMPLKKFGLWNGNNWDLKKDYLLTCSALGDVNIGGAFHVLPDHRLHGMYPRNHYLIQGFSFLTEEEQKYLNLLEEQKKKGRKILFYLPTFRKTQLQFLGESNPEVIAGFLQFLEDHRYFLVTKMHFVGYFEHQDMIGCTAANMLNLPPQLDIYPFLRETDILLTDYSSVFFDFLYLDRPIICYPYDIDEYKKEDQGLLIDYNSLPADKVFTLSELEENLKKKMDKHDKHADARKAWLSLCFDNQSMDNTITNTLRHGRGI